MGWGLPPPERYAPETQKQPCSIDMQMFGDEKMLIDLLQGEKVRKRGLFIGGGGAAGAINGAALGALAESGIFQPERVADHFSFLAGNSAGAAAIAYTACGMPEALQMYWKENIDNNVFHVKNAVRKKTGEKRGIINYDPVEDEFRNGTFKLDVAKIRAYPIPLYVGVMPEDGPHKYEVVFVDLRKVKDPVDVILASMRLPFGNRKPIHIDGIPHSDGGLPHSIPIDKLQELVGFDELLLFLTNPWHISKRETRGNNYSAKAGRRTRNGTYAHMMLLNGTRREELVARVDRHMSIHTHPRYLIFAPDKSLPGPFNGLTNHNATDIFSAAESSYMSMRERIREICGMYLPKDTSLFQERPRVFAL